MKASAKKLAGLRRYHANRPVKTRLKLLEALDRMESGHTVVVGPEFKWSKTTLAREAGRQHQYRGPEAAERKMGVSGDQRPLRGTKRNASRR